MNNNHIYHKKYLKYKKKYLDLKKDIEGGFFTSSSNPTKKLRDAMIKEYNKYKKEAEKEFPKIYYGGRLSDYNIKKITKNVKDVLENKIPLGIRTANLTTHIKKEGKKETIDLTDDLVGTELSKIMNEATGVRIGTVKTENLYPLTIWVNKTVLDNLVQIHRDLIRDPKMQKYEEKDQYAATEPNEVLLKNIKKLNEMYDEAQKCFTFTKNGKYSSSIKNQCDKYKTQAINEIGKIFQKMYIYEKKQSKVIDNSVNILNAAQLELNKLGIKYSRAAKETVSSNYTPDMVRDVQQKALRAKKLELIEDLKLYGIERDEVNLSKIQEYIMKQETVIDNTNIKKLQEVGKNIEKNIKEVTNM